jgi:hypothetical protein
MTILSVILLAAFAGSCFLLIVDGFRRRTGILELPFLAGGAMAGYLLPQAIGVARNVGMAPQAGIYKALIMCTLCTLATYFGWHWHAPDKWLQPSTRRYSNGGLYALGIVLLAIGLVGYLKLSALSGGIAAHYSKQGSYALTWSGLPVVYYFFSMYLMPAMVLCSLVAIKSKSIVGLIAPGIVVAIQLATLIFLGRRTDAVALFLSVACILYFSRGWLPPRLLVYALIPVGAAALYLAPVYRAHSEIGNDPNAINDIDSATTVHSVLTGTRGEFWTACYLIQITDDNFLYQYGIGFYNTFINYYIPKMIVGPDVKAALLIPIPVADHIANDYAWEIPLGMVPTGPGSVYQQFWFFGAVLYFYLARFLKYLWTRSTVGKDLLSQATYALAATAALASIVNDFYAIYITLFMFWLPLLLFSRIGLISGQTPVAQPIGLARL